MEEKTKLERIKDPENFKNQHEQAKEKYLTKFEDVEPEVYEEDQDLQEKSLGRIKRKRRQKMFKLKTLVVKPQSRSIRKDKKSRRRTSIIMKPSRIDNSKSLSNLQRKINEKPASAVDQHLADGINS